MIVTNMTVDIAGLTEISEGLKRIKKSLPTVSLAVEQGAHLVMRRWKAYAAGSKIPRAPQEHHIKNPKGGYSQSIRMRKLDNFSAIVYSESSVASKLEYGTGEAIDLKIYFAQSDKRRETEEGGWYLTIPFRTNVDKIKSVLKSAGFKIPKGRVNKMFETMSKQTGVAEAKSIHPTTGKQRTGNLIAEGKTRGKVRTYKWGSKLRFSKVARQSNKDLDKLNNMVRMQGVKDKAGRQTSSAYLTFRRASNKSDGWIIRDFPKKPIMGWAVKNSQKEVQELIFNAFMIDLQINIGAR